MKVSIIVPVYNEELTVRKILAKVFSADLPSGMTREIIVVDDGSTDDSVSKIKKTKGAYKLIQHKKNQGKGSAVRTGISSASGEVVLIQDADLEYNPQDYMVLLAPFANSKVKAVFGSRLIDYPLRLFGPDKTPMPMHWIANKLLTLLTNILYGQGLTDMETCYKVIRRKLLLDLQLESMRFDIEPEITAKILKKGVLIHEIPIKVKPRDYKSGKKIGWKDGVIAVWALIKYRFVP